MVEEGASEGFDEILIEGRDSISYFMGVEKYKE